MDRVVARVAVIALAAVGTSALENGAARTPPLGFSNWNVSG
jgi:hypothetical protein